MFISLNCGAGNLVEAAIGKRLQSGSAALCFHSLEGRSCVELRANLPELLFRARVAAFLHHFAGRVALLPRFCKADIGPDAQGQGLLLAEKAISQTPVFGAVGHHEKEERTLVRELVSLRQRLGIFDAEYGKRHGGISIRNRVEIVPICTTNWGYLWTNPPEQASDKVSGKALIFQPVGGRLGTRSD